jgi:4-hydroxy-tetrahydrodipicolinate reductase
MGRMGSAIVEEARKFPDIKIVAGFDKAARPVYENITIFADEDKIGEVCNEVDVWIDFTTPQAFVSNLPFVAKQGMDLVIGTTGWHEKLKFVEELVKKNNVCAIVSPNFSPLVNMQFYLCKIASRKLSPLGYDFGIVEEHHEGKSDVPSGTADKLADMIMGFAPYRERKIRQRGIDKKLPSQLDMASLRLKGTVGDHEVRIRGENGRLNIDSMIYNRGEFARGALHCTEWLSKNRCPGSVLDFYKDVLVLDR